MGRFDDLTLESIKMIAKTPAKEIDRRRINLWFHRFLYYKHDTQMISDFEYDKKKLNIKYFGTITQKLNLGIRAL